MNDLDLYLEVVLRSGRDPNTPRAQYLKNSWRCYFILAQIGLDCAVFYIPANTV